jgi:hypothetical protein
MKAIGILFVATLAACEATTASSGSQLSSAPSQIQAVSAQSAAFAAYKTFGFRLAETPPPPYQVSARSFDVERRVHDLVAAELTRRGYTESATNPDFVVRLSSGTAKEEKAQPTTTSGANENETQSVTAGAIVIDAFDRSTSQQVWHGTARAEIDPQRINEASIQAAVQQMMASFPARSGAPAQP